MCIPVGLYLFIYVMCIAVFGNHVTENLIYPTIELAKAVDIPGEFFERFESIFFVVWIMAFFIKLPLPFAFPVFEFPLTFKKFRKFMFILFYYLSFFLSV